MALYALRPRGVFNTVTMQLITPANYVLWQAYEAWLAAGNTPDALPVVNPFPTLASQRTEMLARLDAEFFRRLRFGTFVSQGRTWWVHMFPAITTPRLITPLPAGFQLPDVTRTQVPMNNPQLTQLNTDLSTYLQAVNTRYAALVTAIGASATPLTVNILTGWP